MKAVHNEQLPPWAAYHKALRKAHMARGHFFRYTFVATTKALKDRICHQAQKWNIRLCPLRC